MKPFLSFAILLSSVIFLSACKKANTDITTAKIRLIGGLQTTSNGIVTDTISYTYDSSNRITEVIETNATTALISTLLDTKFTYDSNDRITEADLYTNGQPTSKNIFTYSTGSASEQSTIYYNGTTILSNQTLTLNSNQHVSKKSTDANNYSLYTYDTNGNVTTITQYTGVSATTPSTVYSATYDNNKSTFLNVKGNYYLWYEKQTPNNIIASTTTSYSQPAYNYVYNGTFNSDGYLNSRVVNVTGPITSTYTTSYTYIMR